MVTRTNTHIKVEQTKKISVTIVEKIEAATLNVKLAEDANKWDSHTISTEMSLENTQELIFDHNSVEYESVDLEIILFGPSVKKKKKNVNNSVSNVSGSLNQSNGSDVDFLDYF